MDLFEAAKTVSTEDIATHIGLEPAGASGKYGCVSCRSSDALHCYSDVGRGSYCYSCGRDFSTIDLVAAHHRMEPVEAAKWICESYGIDYDGDEGESVADRRRSENVLEDMWSHLEFDERARAFCESRSIPPAIAEHVGIRTIRSGWLRKLIELGDDEEREALCSAGIARKKDGAYRPHPWWRGPYLWIPYWKSPGGIDTVRCRALGQEVDIHTMGLCGRPSGIHQPQYPYAGWGARDALRDFGGPLYIVEGEIDCLSLYAVDRTAIGAPGASVWRDRWSRLLGSAQSVAVIGDGDEGGLQLVRTVTESLRRVHGTRWVGEHVRGHRWPDGMDANDLLRDDRLSRVLERFEYDR